MLLSSESDRFNRIKLKLPIILDISNVIVGWAIHVIGSEASSDPILLYGVFILIMGIFRSHKIIESSPDCLNQSIILSCMVILWILYTIAWSVTYDRNEDTFIWYTGLFGTLYPIVLIFIAALIAWIIKCITR